MTVNLQTCTTTMKTFKNIHYTKRDYECTNVVYATGNNAPSDTENWIETTEEIPPTMSKLWIEGGVQFYGFL